MESKTNSWLPPSILTPFQQFARSESVGGFLLILSALFAFAIANSAQLDRYTALQSIPFGLSLGDWSLIKPLILWINDGLMAVFFLMVGLEIKREIVVGELSRPRDAAFSVFAAIGGMIVPALIYVLINRNGEGVSGWGIPMATDIAFALGIMSLLGKCISLPLKVFLTALAIVDDLGAVIVIAVFYTASLDGGALIKSFLVLAIAWFYGYTGGRRLSVFGLLGVIGWYFMLKSGVHATIAGVLLAFTIPMGRRSESAAPVLDTREILAQGTLEEIEVKVEHAESFLHGVQSPLHRLEHALHPWVVFFIMPVFAFFNAGVSLSGEGASWSAITSGCFLGLIVGKPIGIFFLSWLSCRLGIASLPSGVTWFQIASVGLLAGIGFTMSFFVAGLAFENGTYLDQAKIGVLSASILSAAAGLIALWMACRTKSLPE